MLDHQLRCFLGGIIKIDGDQWSWSHDIRDPDPGRVQPPGKHLQEDLAGGDDSQTLLEEALFCHQNAALLLRGHHLYGIQHHGLGGHGDNGIAHQISDLHGTTIPLGGQ